MSVRASISGTLSGAPPFGWPQDIRRVSPGTLWLWDPFSPSGGFSMPLSNGSPLVNLAATNCAGIIGGAATPSNCVGVVSYARESASTLVVEKTPKGGLHVIQSQTLQTLGFGNRTWVYVSGTSTPIPTYMLGLVPGATVYVCTARRLTRAAVLSQAVPYCGLYSSTNDNVYLFGIDKTGKLVGSGLAPKSAVINGVLVSAIAVNAWTGTKPAAVTMQLGGSGGTNASGNTFANKMPSVIEYGSRIEHLGLTHRANGGAGGTPEEEYELAWQEDLSFFRWLFGQNGPAYGDTWSDPLTTLP